MRRTGLGQNILEEVELGHHNGAEWVWPHNSDWRTAFSGHFVLACQA